VKKELDACSPNTNPTTFLQITPEPSRYLTRPLWVMWLAKNLKLQQWWNNFVCSDRLTLDKFIEGILLLTVM